MLVNTHGYIFLSLRLSLVFFEKVSALLEVELTQSEASANVALGLKHLTHIVSSQVLLRIGSGSALDNILFLLFIVLLSESSHESHDAILYLVSGKSELVSLHSDLLALILLLILSLLFKLFSHHLAVVMS